MVNVLCQRALPVRRSEFESRCSLKFTPWTNCCKVTENEALNGPKNPTHLEPSSVAEVLMERLWEVFFCIIIAPFELSSARLGVSLSLEQTFVHTTTAAMITTTKTNQILITAKPERSTLSLDLWTNFLGGNKSLFRWFAQGLKCCAQNGKNESSLRAFDVTFWKWFNAYFYSHTTRTVSQTELSISENTPLLNLELKYFTTIMISFRIYKDSDCLKNYQ